MKKAVNIQVEEEIIKEFKLMAISKDKFMGCYLEELIKKELNRQNGNKTT